MRKANFWQSGSKDAVIETYQHILLPVQDLRTEVQFPGTSYRSEFQIVLSIPFVLELALLNRDIKTYQSNLTYM